VNRAGRRGRGDDSLCVPTASIRTTAQKIRSARCLRSCGGFECHAGALALEEVDRAPRDALAVLPIIVIGTKLSMGRVIREDMVRRAQESMGYRRDGFLGTAVRRTRRKRACNALFFTRLAPRPLR
jgi:hypothetical protein